MGLKNSIISYFSASVWFINGLFCKLLNLVPRHQQIVSEILGAEYSSALTKSIGLLEVLMAVWIISGIYSKWNVRLQIGIILLMNILEVSLTPHLLLWGKFNLFFALLFSILIYYNEFVVKQSSQYH